MSSEKLNAAIQQIQSGHKQTAVPMLRELIQENPADDQPWLWLHLCMDDLEQKKFCLQRALMLNPANEQARLALQVLMEPVESVSPSVVETEKKPWEDDLVPDENAIWQRTEPDEFGWKEDRQPEKFAEKFEWEQTENVQKDEDRLQTGKALPTKAEQAKPVYAKPLQRQTVKATSQPLGRRKARGKRRSLFPILAGLVLLIMLTTVCLVFFAQLYHP